jgi:hypothetical protein
MLIVHSAAPSDILSRLQQQGKKGPDFLESLREGGGAFVILSGILSLLYCVISSFRGKW